MLETEAS